MAGKQVTKEQEERIRKRAYELWEQEGRPDSRHQEHWSKAVAELGEALERPEGAELHRAEVMFPGYTDGGPVPWTPTSLNSMRMWTP